MSHEIRECDTVESTTQEWHGLAHVKPDLSLENCQFTRWDYVSKPVMVDGKKTPFAILGCTDEPQMVIDEATGETGPLIIGNPYQVKSFKPVFNARLIEVVSAAIAGHGLTMKSAGTVMNRGRLFMSFNLADAAFNAGGRDFLAFLNIVNGNDKTAPLMANTSNIACVCNNTVNINLGSAGQIMEIKKTQFSDLKIGDMGKAIKAMFSGQKEFAKAFGMLAGIECDENTARKFFAGFVGQPDMPLSTRAENTVERLLTLFKAGAGNNGDDFADTFSAISDFYSHESASGKGDDSANWKNFVSSEFGSGKQAKMDAWEIVVNDKSRKGIIAIGSKILKLTADEHRKENAAK